MFYLQTTVTIVTFTPQVFNPKGVHKTTHEF